MLPHKPHDDLLSILSRILGSAPVTRHHSWGRGGRGRWWQGPGGSAQDTTLASLDDCVGVVWGCLACIFHPYWYQHPNFASGNHPDPILSPCSWIKTNLALCPKDGHLTQARESAYSTLLAIRDLGSTPGLTLELPGQWLPLPTARAETVQGSQEQQRVRRVPEEPARSQRQHDRQRKRELSGETGFSPLSSLPGAFLSSTTLVWELIKVS